MKAAGAKPRVLFVGPVPPPYSGPEMSMQLFLDSPLREEFEIRHLRTNVRATNKNKGRFDLRMIAAFFRFVCSLLVQLVRFRPLVVYYPITPTQIGWVGRDCWCLLLSRLFRAKTVIHMRGSHFRLNFESFHPLVRRLVRFCCSGVSAAIVQAEYLRAQFEGLVAAQDIHVLYNAIDAAEYRGVSCDSDDELGVLFLGHMTKAKGYCDLMRALPRVAGKIPNVKFHVAGTLRTGERNVFFNQVTGERLEYEDPRPVHADAMAGPYRGNYVYHGVVSGGAKLELLHSASVYVSPSYSEGFSRALLEAMSAGKALVCTPVGAHREVLAEGKNGRLVMPGDVEGLAAAITELLENPQLRGQMGSQNAKDAVLRFDIAPISRQFGDLLHSVIEARNS